MNTITFYNKNEEVHILFKENKIVYKGQIYDIETAINTTTTARFSFWNYSCKINRDILTLVDSNGISTTFLKKQVQNEEITQEEWDMYVIYTGNYISINVDRSKIKLNERIIHVKEVKKYGIFIEYTTEEGTLRIYKDTSKNPQWKNVYIKKI